MLKKHTVHFEEEGRAYYISTNQWTCQACNTNTNTSSTQTKIQIPGSSGRPLAAFLCVAENNPALGNDHCSAKTVPTVGVISSESFIPGEQLWKLFPYSLKKSFGSDQPVSFLWNCFLPEIIESIADKVVSLFAVGDKI